MSKKCPLKTIGRLCNTYTYTTSSGEKDCRVFGAVNSVFVKHPYLKEMMYGLCVCVPVYACLCLCVYCATVWACKRVSVCEGVKV